MLQEFEKQSEIMDMKEEMMNDSIDEAMEGDDDEEERYVGVCTPSPSRLSDRCTC